MANELEITGQGTALDFYAIVRRRDDAKVWNVVNSAFETWSDGTVADYDTVLADKGGDLYQADFPTAIAAGTNVRIQYYERDGATPAITDLLLDTLETTWTGQGISGSGSVSLNANALCTLEALKRQLHITASTHDDLLRQIINDVSGLIIRITGREFIETTYTDWLPVTDTGTLMVKQFPLIQLNRIGTGNVAALSAIYAGSDIRARVSVTDTGVVLTSTSAAGTITTNTLLFTSNPTFSTMVTAITAVSDWTGTLAGDDGASSNLRPVGGSNALNSTVNVEWASTEVDDWTADYSTGIIKLQSSLNASRLAMVEYIGGYATTPSEVAGVAIQIASVQFGRSQLNTGVGSEGLGDWSYSPATPAAVSDDQLSQLRPFIDYSAGVAV